MSYKRFTLFRAACFFLFVGHAWQHLVWDVPLRALLWDQDLMEGLIRSMTGLSWQEYANGEAQERAIATVQRSLGVFYALCALLVLVIRSHWHMIGRTLLVASFFLFTLALLHFKDHFLHAGQLFEYSLQVATPLLLYSELFHPNSRVRALLFAKIAIALTFLCHGLYAIGYYPQPGNYVDMMISGFGLNEPNASTLLYAAGAVDILAAMMIFVPITMRVALWYACIWGLLTALARTTTGFYIDLPWDSLNQVLPQTLMRLPHGLIPLWILIITRDHIK